MPEIQDPDYERRAREGFARQEAMRTIGAVLESVSAGEIEIRLPFDPRFTQQHGYLHAAIVTAAIDTACGFAAMTLTPPGANILTVEYKINFMAPARGKEFRCRGRVVKPGKTLTICQGEAVADDGTVVAAML